MIFFFFFAFFSQIANQLSTSASTSNTPSTSQAEMIPVSQSSVNGKEDNEPRKRTETSPGKSDEDKSKEELLGMCT